MLNVDIMCEKKPIAYIVKINISESENSPTFQIYTYYAKECKILQLYYTEECLKPRI